MSIGDLDDVTPADPPGAALSRLAEHQRELCATFDRVAPLLETARGSDRVYLIEKLAALCAEGERAFRDCNQALTALYELEAVFRPRKDRP